MSDFDSENNLTFEKLLVSRDCPICGSHDSKTEFEIGASDFVQNNPTHNLSWFEELRIPSNFQFPFNRCKECSFLFSGFRLNESTNYDFYNEGILADASKEKIYTKKKRIFNCNLWIKLLDHSEDYETLKVLDFGGGWGDFLLCAKSYGIETFGLEFDNRKISHAKQSGVLLGDFNFISENAPYNIFVCNQVLEHLQDPLRALDEINKLCTQGAVGFIGVPNFNEKKVAKIKESIAEGNALPKEVNPFGHLNYFSPDHLSKILRSKGFEILAGLNEPQRTFMKKKSIGADQTMLFVRKV